MRCIVVCFENQKIRVPLPAMAATIGSATTADIVLPFPGVSRLHARISREGSAYRLTDLGSKNKLLLGEQRLEEVELAHGTIVQIGRAFVAVEEASTSDVDLAISREQTSSPTDHSTAADDSESSDTAAPIAALRFIRRVEATRGRHFSSNRKELFAEAARLLGASSAATVTIDSSGEVAFDLIAGALPSESSLEELRFLAFDRRQKEMPLVRRIGDRRVVYWIDRRKRGAAALVLELSAAHPGAEAAILDLTAYVGLKFVDSHTDPTPLEGSTEERRSLRPPPEMVAGSSMAMKKLLGQIEATLSSRMDVLLWGETGTGKELVARMIHASGPTSGGPFVAINCAAIPSELLEAELFGVEGRVATGVDPRKGQFLLADGGSIFLDEIGELPDRLQAKLLRVLQEREVLSLGASRPKRINLRVIAASNRDLYACTADGKFRADLYYRLRGLQFHIPPLRDRREDIPELVLAFVDRACVEYGKHVRGVSRKALAILMEYDWPGNVRELKSEVDRAVLVTPNGTAVQADALGPVCWAIEHRRHGSVRNPIQPDSGITPGTARAVAAPQPPAKTNLSSAIDREAGATASEHAGPAVLRGRLEELEREEILRVLQQTAGNRSRAARILGISRNGLSLKLKRLGLS